MQCHICQNDKNAEIFTVREIARGTGHPFTYFRCCQCNCLQISEIPEDMSFYYDPSSYYSLQPSPSTEPSHIKRLFLQGKNFATFFIARPLGKVCMREYFRHKWVTMVPWSRKQRILDVGCGRGDLLRSMQYAGFKDLTGIDPFLPQEISENGFHLYRKKLEELEGKYDVIVSCHSLEHLSDQHSAMRSLKQLLAPNGYLAIMIPMYNEYFLRKYGNAWCSWSIPHHFYLHSMESFQKLLSANNLQIEKSIQSTHISYVYDSERYLAMLSDDPLVKKRFAETSMAEWKREMWRVIRAGNGDCGLFLIRHKN